MVRAAMVFMILAGILGLPAVMCSGACASLMTAAEADTGPTGGKEAYEFLFYLACGCSLGSIVCGALVRRLGKAASAILCLVFSLGLGALVIQMNILGIVSALILLVAAIMIFVAPRTEFAA